MRERRVADGSDDDAAPPPGSGDDDRDRSVVPADHATAWVVVGGLAAVAAIWLVLPGILGMAAGSVAHLKGQRAGMPVAVASAVTTLVGMALAFWVS